MNEKEKNGLTKLQSAVQDKNLEMVDSLLKSPGDMNARNSSNSAPIQFRKVI